MPFYEAGDHKVDHPPLFACREHKQFLRLRSSFIDEMLRSLEDMVPGNLHEIAAPSVNGDTNAFRLPEHLIPPRVLIYNPDFLKGPCALPYTLVFVDKRFIGIPAAYLTADRFEGCADCTANPPPPPARPVAQQRPNPAGSSTATMRAIQPPQKQPSTTGSGIMRQVPAPGGPPKPATRPAPAPARPATQSPPPARKPGPPPPARPPQR